MRPFIFSTAETTDQAISTSLAEKDAKYLGGGTNLIDLMKEDVERPTHLIEVADISWNEIRKKSESGCSLGAMCSNSETANHPTVRKYYPLLSMAMLSAATAQIRNMATNGGNLLQRTRCPYFYETSMPCNKREPGSGCGALKGENHNHAIFGWTESCVATHPSDMCVALAAIGAKIQVQSADGSTRMIDFDSFHRLPGNQPDKDTNLDINDLILSIELPKPHFEVNYHYLKIRERSSYAFALISVAAGLEFTQGKIAHVGLAMGGVAHKPWKLKDSEDFLKGKTASQENFMEAAELAMQDAKTLSQNEYKVEMGKNAIVRALTQAVERNSLV